MLTQVYATKQHMTQAWTTAGKRVAVTRLRLDHNVVVGEKPDSDSANKRLEIGFGKKKLKNMTKPLRSRLEKSGFSFGVKALRETILPATSELKAGDTIKVESVLSVGDVVSVQGVTKGRGFAGAMKRHGFSGGPKTHGQSDRWRAVGAIGQRTTPGRVFKGKRMPGHYGVAAQTVRGLVVLHVDPVTQELWLSGPVPGSLNGIVRLTKLGQRKEMTLDLKASGIKVAEVTEAEAPKVESVPEVAVEPAVEPIAEEVKTGEVA